MLRLGAVFLVAILIALAAFWKQCVDATKAEEPNSIWLQIVAAGWASRIVTISTALLRTDLAVQAGFFTSMTAALVLERVGTSLLDAPFCSTMRALQGSPHTLLRRTMMRLRNPTSVILFILILVEVAATLASQLMSTLLLANRSLDLWFGGVGLYPSILDHFPRGKLE